MICQVPDCHRFADRGVSSPASHPMSPFAVWIWLCEQHHVPEVAEHLGGRA